MKFIFYFIATLLYISYTNAQNVKTNITNVGVYLNKISSCNFNSQTGNLLCASQEFETLIQYHNVKYIKMCDYHYCIKFENDDKTLSCSGYVLKPIGGNMDTLINPLSPFDRLLYKDSSNVHKIDKKFMGYNIKIDSFIQNVQTTFEDSILDIECKLPHSTCIRFENKKDLQCFGSEGLTFYDSSTSIVWGIFIPTSFAFLLYSISYSLCFEKFSSNHFVIFILIPVLVFTSSLILLFWVERFIVKEYVFFIGNIFGIILGHQISRLLVFTINRFKQKSPVTIQNAEEKKSLRENEENNDSFEIREDNDGTDSDSEENNKDVVTIELK